MRLLATLLAIAAAVAIVAGVGLQQAEAGFVETFNSGYVSGLALNTQAPWRTAHPTGIGTFADDPITANATGRTGAVGDFGAYLSSGNVGNGASRSIGNPGLPGDTLTFSADFRTRPTETETGQAYIGWLSSTDNNEFVRLDIRCGTYGNIYPSLLLAYDGNGHGGWAPPGGFSGFNALDPGAWYRVTSSLVVGGGPGNLTTSFYRYSDGATATATNTYTFSADTPLDRLWISGTRDGVIWDNISATGGRAPEPSTVVLLATGLIALLAYAWRNRKSRKLVGAVFIVALLAAPAGATNYYVAGNGSNGNSGTSLAQPFLTIQQAADLAQPGDQVFVRGGTYRETVTMARSGTANAPITFQPYGSEQVTITGLDPVTGWSAAGGGSIYSSAVNSASQVFVGGKPMTEARWPNSSANNPFNAVYARVQSSSIQDPSTTSTITDAALGNPSDNYWAGAKMAVTPGVKYYTLSAPITSQTGNTLSFPWASGTEPSYAPQNGDRYWLYGALKAVDASKEYYYDGNAKQLYLYAPGGVNPNTQTVEARTRTYGLNLGSQSYINVSGFSLKAASINVAGNNNRIDRVQVLYPTPFADPGSAQEGTGDVRISGQYNTLSNSEVAYSWGGGVKVTGDNNTINNNLIHDVWAGSNSGLINIDSTWNSTVTHNTVYGSARLGISHYYANNALITNNEVARFGYLTSDLGGIYSSFTNGGGTVIAYNYIHDAKSVDPGSPFAAGLYLDGGNGYFTVHHNVVSNVRYGLITGNFSQHEGIYNNTLWGIYPDRAMVGTLELSEDLNTYNNLSNAAPFFGTSTGTNITTPDDPFVNAAAGNFTLKSGSAPVNAGTVIPGITNGFVDTAPDVGAFELGATPWKAGANWKTWTFANQTAVPLQSALSVMSDGTRVSTGSLVAGNTSTTAGRNSRAFLKFNLTGVTGALQSAVLRIFEDDDASNYPNNGGAMLHRVLSDWNPSTVIYDQSVSATGTSFYDPDNVLLYTDVDITSIVNGWLADPSTDFGLSIRGSEGLLLSAKYFGGAYDVTPPQLLLTFAVPEPGTISLLASAALAGLGIMAWRKHVCSR